MNTLRFLLIWLAYISPALTAVAAVSGTIQATLDAQGDATIDSPQFLATLLAPHFDDQCSPVTSKKQLHKRGLTANDQNCIAYSAYSLAVFAASNSVVQNALSSIPTNFDVKGGLIDVRTQVKTRINQNPSRFTARIFSPQSIDATLAYLATLAGYVRENGAGTEITHIVFTLADSEIETTASCSSWTFTWTSPPSTETVPAFPCVPTEAGIADEGTSPSLWAAEIARFDSVIANASNLASATQSPIGTVTAYPVASDIVCRPKQSWYNACQLPNTADSEIDSCIKAFQDPTQNPTWVDTMQPESQNISMPCHTNKGTVYQLIIVSWVPGCPATFPNGRMRVDYPTGSIPFTFAKIMRGIYDGCRNYAQSLDPQTQMLYQVPGSAGLGTNIGNLPHQGNVLPNAEDNNGIGGKQRIGCLMFEIAANKNNPYVNNAVSSYKGHEGVIVQPDPVKLRQYYQEVWPTLGSKFYDLDNGYGQYCPIPSPFLIPKHPCPIYPCYIGPAQSLITPPNGGGKGRGGGIPNHNELFISTNSSANSSTTSSNKTSSISAGSRGPAPVSIL